jgi:thioredoxin-like negative regulator of GroEL
MGSSFILETYLRELSATRTELEFNFFDSDEQTKLAAYFDVSEIPTTLYLYNGEIVGRFSQLRPKRKIERWLDDHSKKKKP